jgi:hypothetical protein
LQYSHSSVNQFSFQGVEILETFLVGLLQAQDNDRDLISPQLTARFGITNRFEIEAKAPYVYRDDTLRATIPQIDQDDISLSEDIQGDGLGDVEVALHYQINRGVNGWPFFVGNVRYKSDTGEGPFDVNFNALGVATELPTGSGFQSVEPSLTVLYPSDPVVLFANLGYLINIEEDVDETIPSEEAGMEQRIGDVDPGDAFRVSFGTSYALNERASLTLGYKHDFIKKTKTEINGEDLPSASLDVGSLLLGWGYSLTNRVATNLNLELGVTDDAPDVLITLRVPFVAYEF